MTALADRKPDPERWAGSSSFHGGMLRMVRAIGQRVAEGEAAGPDALTRLREVQETADVATARVVRAMRTQDGGSHSWAEIGTALGITGAAAFKRYGGGESDARRPGGQPAHLR